MKLTLRRMVFALSAVMAGAVAPVALAGPINGPWNVATTNPAGGQGNGPIHFSNTHYPIVGDLVEDGSASSNEADAEMFDSPFPTITLANAGDKIKFTGNVTLTGTVNSPATSGTPRTQFRFGLFNGDDVGLDDNGWVGYYMSNKHGNSGTPAGVLTRKPVGNTSIYLSATGQSPAVASVQGDGTVASLFHDGTYAMSMIIERDALGQLLVSATLTGSNGFSQALSGIDTTASTLGTYTFNHVGFLLGGNLDTDRAAFSNLVVSVPEPASWLLSLSSLVAVCGLRRRVD